MQQDMSRTAVDYSVPKPEVGACYSHGWRMLKKYVLEAFLVTVVALVVSLPGYALMNANKDAGHGNDVLAVIGFIYFVLITRPFKYGALSVLLKAARDERVQVRAMFEALENYLNVVLANLFVCVIIIIGLVLFIVPGLVFACRLSFTPFLVVENRMEAIEAVKESWRLTRGHAWTIFLMALVAIPVVALGVACLGVGLIGAMMWIGMAHASLYYAVTSSAGVVAPERPSGGDPGFAGPVAPGGPA